MKVLFPAELSELAELAQKFLFMQDVNAAEQGQRSHPSDVHLPGVIRGDGGQAMKVLFPAELAELAELAQKFLFMQDINYAEQGLRSHPADVHLPG